MAGPKDLFMTKSRDHVSVAKMSNRPFNLNADLLLRAYRLGLFPMAESRRSRALHWLDPEARGVLPLDGFHMPRSLMKTVRNNRFEVTANADFPGTIAGCAAARLNRPLPLRPVPAVEAGAAYAHDAGSK